MNRFSVEDLLISRFAGEDVVGEYSTRLDDPLDVEDDASASLSYKIVVEIYSVEVTTSCDVVKAEVFEEDVVAHACCTHCVPKLTNPTHSLVKSLFLLDHHIPPLTCHTEHNHKSEPVVVSIEIML